MSIFRYSFKTLFLLLVFTLLISCADSNDPTEPTSGIEPAMDTLVSAEWLKRHIDDPDLIVLDCTVLIEPDEAGGVRIVSGRDHFEAGHIPNAGFADLMGDLSDSDSPMPFVLPAPEQFAAAMSALGIDDQSRVVLYDANTSVWAARVWWMLRWIGFDRSALLDGGLAAWTEAGYSLDTATVHRPAGTLTLNFRPELIADREEVRASLENAAVRLVDAMPEAHYRGDMAMYARPGHIPGAVNVPSSLLVDETGRYRSQDELEMLFGGNRDARTITYCGGGIAASSNAFVLSRLGFTDVAVYADSLQEWAADPENPMEVGDEPDG